MQQVLAVFVWKESGEESIQTRNSFFNLSADSSKMNWFASVMVVAAGVFCMCWHWVYAVCSCGLNTTTG